MKFVVRGCVILFILLFISGCYGTADEGVRGFYFKNDLKNPLAGALVVLYNADNDLLVDYTYTVDNGRFTLRGPYEKGHFYVVATKDRFSDKVSFEYNPESPSANLMIQHQDTQNGFVAVIDYIVGKFDDVIKVLVGLFLGLGFKWHETKQKAKKAFAREFGEIEGSVHELLSHSTEVRASIEAFNKAVDQHADRKLQDYLDAVGSVKEDVNAIQTRLDANTNLEEVVYELYKKSGTDNLIKLKATIKQIQRFTGLEPDRVLTRSEKQNDLLRLVEELHNNPLLKSR
jgi:hypothetical protein